MLGKILQSFLILHYIVWQTYKQVIIKRAFNLLKGYIQIYIQCGSAAFKWGSLNSPHHSFKLLNYGSPWMSLTIGSFTLIQIEPTVELSAKKKKKKPINNKKK